MRNLCYELRCRFWIEELAHDCESKKTQTLPLHHVGGALITQIDLLKCLKQLIIFLDYHSACWKKSDKGEAKPSGSAISGPKFCGDPPEPNDCFEYKTNYYGFDMEDGQYNSQASAEACQIECQNTNGCEYWTWDPSMGLSIKNVV